MRANREVSIIFSIMLTFTRDQVVYWFIINQFGNKLDLVNDFTPKKAKLASADDLGNENDTSVVPRHIKFPGKILLLFA